MKSHFLNSDIPRREGGELQAMCGEFVQDAAFAEVPIDRVEEAPDGSYGMWDHIEFNPLRDCKRCWVRGFPLRYVYRIVPAGSLKNRGEE